MINGKRDDGRKVGKRARKRSDGKNSVKRLGKKSKRNRAIEREGIRRSFVRVSSEALSLDSNSRRRTDQNLVT